MDSEKIELRKLLFKHSSEASNLLKSDYYGLGTALTRYLNFIDGQPVIRAFIEDCLANYLPEGFDANAELNEVTSDPYTIFEFPPSCEGECAITYLVLKVIVERGLCQSLNLLLGYAHGSKKYDDMVEGFVNDVARRLVNGVNQAIAVPLAEGDGHAPALGVLLLVEHHVREGHAHLARRPAQSAPCSCRATSGRDAGALL